MILEGGKFGFKPADIEEPVNLHINRPIAAVFVRLLSGTPASPNQISWLVIGLSVIIGILFSFGKRELTFAAAILTQVASILDCVDGQLARTTGRVSQTGKFLEYISGGFVAVIFLGVVKGHIGEVVDIQAFMIFLLLCLSSGIQGTCYQHYRDRYLDIIKTGDRKEIQMMDRESLKDVLKSHPFLNVLFLSYLILFFSSVFRWIFGFLFPERPGSEVRLGVSRRRRLVKAMSFFGAGTQFFLLFICGLLNRPQFFIGYVLIPANILLCLFILCHRFTIAGRPSLGSDC